MTVRVTTLLSKLNEQRSGRFGRTGNKAVNYSKEVDQKKMAKGKKRKIAIDIFP